MRTRAGGYKQDKWVNAFLTVINVPGQRGLYARRPVADEPAERLAALPPTTVIYGERDWVMTESSLAAARELGCRLHVLPGGFRALAQGSNRPGPRVL